MRDGFYWVRLHGVAEPIVAELTHGEWFITAWGKPIGRVTVLSPRLEPPATPCIACGGAGCDQCA